MTFSPMPTNMDEARKEILVWREHYKRKEEAKKQASKPLTQQEVVDAFCVTPHQVQYVSVFDAGVRFAEKHHGITGEEA